MKRRENLTILKSVTMYGRENRDKDANKKGSAGPVPPPRPPIIEFPPTWPGINNV